MYCLSFYVWDKQQIVNFTEKIVTFREQKSKTYPPKGENLKKIMAFSPTKTESSIDFTEQNKLLNIRKEG